MGAVRLAPTGNWNDRGAGFEGQKSEALESPGGVSEEIDRDAIPGTGVLVEDVDDNPATTEDVENGFERALFGQGAEAGPAEAPRDDGIKPGWLERPPNEM